MNIYERGILELLKQYSFGEVEIIENGKFSGPFIKTSPFYCHDRVKDEVTKSFFIECLVNLKREGLFFPMNDHLPLDQNMTGWVRMENAK